MWSRSLLRLPRTWLPRSSSLSSLMRSCSSSSGSNDPCCSGLIIPSGLLNYLDDLSSNNPRDFQRISGSVGRLRDNLDEIRDLRSLIIQSSSTSKTSKDDPDPDPELAKLAEMELEELTESLANCVQDIIPHIVPR